MQMSEEVACEFRSKTARSVLAVYLQRMKTLSSTNYCSTTIDCFLINPGFLLRVPYFYQ